MKKFSFPLEKLLRHREALRQAAERDLGAAIAVAREHEQRVQQALAELAERHAELGRQLAEAHYVDVEGLRRQESYLLWLERHILTLRQALRRAEEQAEAARQRLVEARREERAVEILKEKALKRYRQDVAREEQVMIDEAVMIEYVRRTAGEPAGGTVK
ncbi:MAG: flagellar export protein FliJ [Candidatus Schekmanbacteria bacterium]|nr:flagellar export protein FliJ [Candidatus Schekmanbacteria bacterium]